MTIQRVKIRLVPDPIIFVHRIIDSVWTCRGTLLSDGTLLVTYYGRDDMEGYRTEKQHPKGDMLEKKTKGCKRHAYAAKIDGKTVKLANAAFVFNWTRGPHNMRAGE